MAVGAAHAIAPGITRHFRLAGHILGAAGVELTHPGGRLVVSGDLGRYDSPTMPDPEAVPEADHLLVESTYGNRHHDRASPKDALAAVITRIAARGGSVLVPAFAVGRAQALLHHLAVLKAGGCIPDLPVFLDSPKAQNATDILWRHPGFSHFTPQQCRAAGAVAQDMRDVNASKALNTNPFPKIIIRRPAPAYPGGTGLACRRGRAWRAGGLGMTSRQQARHPIECIAGERP